MAQALAFLRVLRPPSFLPFVVVLALNRRLAIATSDGRALSVTIRSLCQPVVFASSSLGDRLVQTTRGRLFERLVLRSSDPTGAQRRFHSHRWVDRPELSIVMERSDARTVSRTFIQARSRTIEMQYEAL
ncbi:MAG TPA: hypothetical protein VK886_20175 [Vicinamibacterales bacterium]|nr:hypothetical protein [Vicinamibacterales bacterium]